MPSNIPAPRVPMIDPRSGLINRQWYTFFLNLFNLADAGDNSWTLNDLQQMPPVIPYVAPEPVESVPSGVVVMWFGTEASIPAGWSVYEPARGRFFRMIASGGTPGVTGGSVDHLHEVTGGTMGSASATVGVAGGSSYNVATGSHTHSYTDYSSKANNAPLYIDGILIQKD